MRLYWLAGSCLLLALFIYSIYRTEQTVVNIVWKWVLGPTTFYDVRHVCRQLIPRPPGFVVYTLPEGLWVFSASLVSASFYFLVKDYKLPAMLAPLLLAVLLELLQAIHVANGRFDWTDVFVSFTGWALASVVPGRTSAQQTVVDKLTSGRALLILLYGALYLAHVQQT